MRTYNGKNIAKASVGLTPEVLYTLPPSYVTVLKDIQICNNGNSNCEISIWLVPKNESESNENVFLSEYTITANDILHWVGYQVLSSQGDKIVAQSQFDGQITITISGEEIKI